MTINFTQHTLDKLEQLLKEIGYKVRYEKGNFKTGSCLMENNKIIVVNKFSNLESKITALVMLIITIEANETLMSEKQKAFYYSLKQTVLSL